MAWLTRILLLTLLMGATTGFADTGNPAEPQLSQQQLREAYRIRYALEPDDALPMLEDLQRGYSASDLLWEIRAELHLLSADNVNLFRKLGQVRRAIEAYEHVVKIDPYAFRAQGLLFTFYSLPGIGDEEKAESKENELLSLGGGLHAFAQTMQAMVNSDNAGAISQLRLAVEAAPDNPDYHIALIRQLIELDAWQEADAQLATSMALHEGYQPLTYQYARYYVLKESIPPDLHDIIVQLLENNGYAPARLLPESVYLLRARVRQLEGDLQGAAEDYRHVRDHAPKLINDMEFADYEREL